MNDTFQLNEDQKNRPVYINLGPDSLPVTLALLSSIKGIKVVASLTFPNYEYTAVYCSAYTGYIGKVHPTTGHEGTGGE